MEQNQIVQVQKNSGNYLVRRLGIIVSVLVFLLPIFFIPGSLVGLHIAKITLLATGLVAMLVIFLSSVIYNGVIEIPKVKYLIPIGVFALVALISSIFTGAISSSIAGDVFDLGSSGSILILVFSLFVTLLAVKSQNVVNKTILAFVYSNIVLVLYTLVATLGSSILPVSLTSKLPIFLAGGLVDTAIILGGAVIFALCMINMSEVSKHLKYALSVLIALAILFIGASGFQPAIITLGIIALVFFVYVLSWSFNGEKPESNSLESSQNGQEGSVGAATVHDTEQRDSGMVLAFRSMLR
jgi:hypothetical protein